MNETIWEYTVQDFSPLLTYAGIASQASSSHGSFLNSAWQQSCPAGGSPQLSGNTICDVSSVHTTNVSGASVSLSFYGQSVQLFGNVTGGMQYDVNVDGYISTGVYSNQLLASTAQLPLGNHTVRLVAKPPDPGSGATLLFESATVTVGTGLIGANVTRNIVQDNDITIHYSATPASAWLTPGFDEWGIQHTNLNATWHQVNVNTTGSYSLSFSGNAILVHGFSWSYFPSPYRVSIDDEPSVTLFANSSLPDIESPGYIFTDGLTYFRANLSNSPHVLRVDNDNGGGILGLDYVEIINITGGTPLNSPASPDVPTTPGHSTPIGLIVGLVVGVGVPFLLLFAFFIYKYRSGNKAKRSDVETQITPFDCTSSALPESNKGPPVKSKGPSSVGATSSGARYVSVKRGHAAAGSSTSDSTPDHARVSLQAELAQARRSGEASTAEIQAMRRDLQRLLQIVGNTGVVDLPPPEYGAI